MEYALNIWKELNDKGFTFMRRASTFLIALAINQNASHIAIEILTTIRESRYIDVRCLKVLAYAEMKKFTEIVPLFRKSLELDKPNLHKESYFKDVVCIYLNIIYLNNNRCVLFLLYVYFQIEKLEAAMAKEKVPEDFELYKLINLLKNNDHVLLDVSFIKTVTH